MVAPTMDFEVLQNAFPSFRLKTNNIFCHKKSKKGFTNRCFCGILDGSKFIGGIFGFPTLQFASPAISDLSSVGSFFAI